MKVNSPIIPNWSVTMEGGMLDTVPSGNVWMPRCCCCCCRLPDKPPSEPGLPWDTPPPLRLMLSEPMEPWLEVMATPPRPRPEVVDTKSCWLFNPDEPDRMSEPMAPMA